MSLNVSVYLYTIFCKGFLPVAVYMIEWIDFILLLIFVMYYIPYSIWDTIYYRDNLWWIWKAKIIWIRITKDWVKYDTDFLWDTRIWIDLCFEEIAPTKRMLKDMYKQHSKMLIEKKLSNLD